MTRSREEAFLLIAHGFLPGTLAIRHHAASFFVMSRAESSVNDKLTLRDSGWYRAEPVGWRDASSISVNRNNVIHVTMQHDRRPIHNLELDPLTDYWLGPGNVDVISVKRDRRRRK